MKLVSWNVNGIRAVHNKDLLKHLFGLDADVYCLQETKAEVSQVPEEITAFEKNLGYHVYFSHAQNKKGYSGTAIFTKEEPIQVLYNLPAGIAERYELDSDGYGNPNEEGRVIAIELKKCYVVNVYTPNSKGDLSRLELRQKKWDPAFLEYCTLLGRKKPVIFCGDLNVAHTPDDLANPKANERTHGFTVEEREGIHKIIAAGFVDTFRLFTQGNGHYSWWSHFANARARNIGWRIDYWFVPKKLQDKVTKAEILPDVIGSDHCPVTLEIDL